ncbi:MAG: [FeFe] hydrogenase H-cluster radical SAM maturase HydE [Ruminococcaceae bacterium]|nr:[FeFe] hydrogenase H-cluster radical SAM maturase HydE [Oscillospiraceae bacterium]
MRKLIDKLAKKHSLCRSEYLEIIKNATCADAAYLAALARAEKEKHYGKEVFIRGLIEVSNICKNDCYYCGIRKSNQNCERYRLAEEEILECCNAGYELGFRTFVLQGGEDAYFTDERLCSIVSKIKEAHSDCAVTLSLGERTFESYKRLYDAGADRYLLRHETATKTHYEKLHPENLSWDKRMECLENLRKIGYQVGCGFMVGSPYQSVEMLADELVFIEKFKPDMCGIGPFIPHKDTEFSGFCAGSATLTCMLLSMIRLIHPTVLLPATTALGTVSDDGRERGILSGANVVMPNLSPVSVRKKYMLYDNKLSSGAESAEELDKLKQKLAAIGCTVTANRGDVKR